MKGFRRTSRSVKAASRLLLPVALWASAAPASAQSDNREFKPLPGRTASAGLRSSTQNGSHVGLSLRGATAARVEIRESEPAGRSNVLVTFQFRDEDTFLTFQMTKNGGRWKASFINYLEGRTGDEISVPAIDFTNIQSAIVYAVWDQQRLRVRVTATRYGDSDVAIGDKEFAISSAPRELGMLAAGGEFLFGAQIGNEIALPDAPSP